MAATLEQATLALKIDPTQAAMGATRFGTAAGSVKSSANVAKMAVLGLTAALGGAAIHFVKVSSAAQETQSKFNTVFKEMSGSANKWAMSFAQSVGRSSQKVKSYMASLQDMFVPLGIARDKAMLLSESLTALAVDVASFSNKRDADVLRDFSSALVGNHETVRKYGIIISEASIAQEAYVQGLNKAYSQLTDLEKVALRYSLIQKGSTDAQGDAIRTAEEHANQVKRLSANFTEASQVFGDELLPMATEGIKSLNSWFEDNRQEIKQWARDFADGLGIIYTGLKAVWDMSKRISGAAEKEVNQFIIEGTAKDRYKAMYGDKDPDAFKASWSPGTFGRVKTGEQDPKFMIEYRRLYNQVAADAQVGRVSDAQFPNLESRLDALGKPRAGAGGQAPGTLSAADLGGSGLSANPVAKRKLDLMLKEVQKERELLGRVNETRDRSIRLIEFETIAKEQMGYETQSYINMMEDELDQLELAMKIREVADSMEDSFANAFERMAWDAQSFGDAAKQVLQEVAAEALRVALFRPAASAMAGYLAQGITMMIGGLAGGGGGGGTGVSGTTAVGGSAQTGPNFLGGSWLGNVFSGGQMQKFALGGVVSSPAAFSMGSMAEYGPEAIMPLKRGAGGRLGVEMAGGHGARAPMIIINNLSGTSVEQDGEPTRTDEGWVIGLVARNANNGSPLSKALDQKMARRR